MEKKMARLVKVSEEIPDILEKYLVFSRMKLYFLSKRYKTFHICRTLQSNYYELSYSERKIILGAASEGHLCKSIIMENTHFEEKIKDAYYPKYICVIIQFITKINAEKVLKFMKAIQNEKSNVKLGRNKFHFRLVDEKVSNFSDEILKILLGKR
jgi:hypothetical protein